MNPLPTKDLNMLLGSMTNLGYFIFMCFWFFLWNIVLIVFLYFRVFKWTRYQQFIESIKTDETYTFRKKIDVDPLYDEDDDGKEYEINEEFKEESIEVEEILRGLQKKQLGWVYPKSNIFRYIYGWMEASLLWYILWFFATINWILNANFSNNSQYTLFVTCILVWLFFFYNMIFEKIYWVRSQFELIDHKIIETLKRSITKVTNEVSSTELPITE